MFFDQSNILTGFMFLTTGKLMLFSAFQKVTHLYYPFWVEYLLTYLCPSLCLKVSRCNGGKTATWAPVVHI